MTTDPSFFKAAKAFVFLYSPWLLYVENPVITPSPINVVALSLPGFIIYSELSDIITKIDSRGSVLSSLLIVITKSSEFCPSKIVTLLSDMVL